MVNEAKRKGALRAINVILVFCRRLALAGNSKDVATILDVAEYLPVLLLDDRDRTDLFRGHLVDLTQRFPDLAHVLERFDASVD